MSEMSTAEGANLILRFVLEMATLVALAYWGFVTLIPLVVVLPLAGIFVWGNLVAPKARRRLEDPSRLLVEVLFFTSGVAALALADLVVAAVLFAVAALLHVGLMLIFRQR